MVKFEPEAMRALVKYKLLKKQIAQCIDRRDKPHSSDREISPPTEEEIKANVIAMQTFIEYLIDDVVAANQYYNKKFESIKLEYDRLYTLVQADFKKKRGLFHNRKWDCMLSSKISELLGEMLLLQYFSSTNYTGIRKIIKKFHKVTKSSAVDSMMTILSSSPSNNVTTQNDFISDIIKLYYIRNLFETRRKREGLCSPSVVMNFSELEKESELLLRSADVITLREKSMQTIIERNMAVPGKDALRDMVFRGNRILRSRMPKRLKQETPNGSVEEETFADSMQIQMAFYAIPAHLYQNTDGELLDSSELILWEGNLMRRFSALNQWKQRYIVLSNKRICFFRTKFGALKKTVVLCSIISLFNGQSYRYPRCLIINTGDNGTIWLAESSEGSEQFTQFLSTLSELYSHLLLHFWGTDRSAPRESPEQMNSNSLSLRTLSRSTYASITNLFQITPSDNMKDNTQASSSIKMSIPESKAPKLPENMSKVLVTPLEERALQRRVFSQEISSAFYGSETITDIWLSLQKFDRFVNGELTPSKDDISEERDQTTRIREISRITECIQECQAENAKLWQPWLCLFAISILKWSFPKIAAILQGKKEYKEEDIQPSELNINKLFRYERQIGEGHYSSVWIVENKKDHIFYALKKVDIWNLSKYEKIALSREVRNMMLLRGHPNVVKFFGFFADDTYTYIVMELEPGGRLFDYIKNRQQFTENDAKSIVRCVLSAVEYCHQNGIVHRDLKPQNILLTKSDDLTSLKLTDFGFSASVASGLLKTSLGTPGYTAPEVLRNQLYNASVDLWSLGVITYILLCGYPPFPSNNDAERLRAITTGTYQFYPNEWDSVSEEAKDFIRHLIVVDPEKRMSASQCFTHPWLVNLNPSTINLPGVITGIQNIQNYTLQVATKPVHSGIRTHFCRTLMDMKVHTLCDESSSVISVIPKDSPLEVGRDIWNNGNQYGYLTDYCCEYYNIRKGGCVLIQNKTEMFCVHALTYIYKKIAKRTPFIYATPLNTTEIVGKFTQSFLVCDTLLSINNVRWAILHHMMYTPLELSGIPQAWVILEDENEKYFEEMQVSNEFEQRLKEFRTKKKERDSV